MHTPCCSTCAQTFQEQLRDGHVDFLENGSVGFSMPLALALTLTLTVTPNPNPIPNPNPNPHQVRFSMPLTHRIAPFVHPALVEAIETVAGAAQRGYRRLPRQWRQQVEALLDWAVESGALHAAVVVLLTVILLDVLLHVANSRPEASANFALQHAPPAPDQAQGGLQPRPMGRYLPAGRPHRPCSPRRFCLRGAASDETTS